MMAEEISRTNNRSALDGYIKWKRLQYRRKISWDCIRHEQNAPPPTLDLSLAKVLSTNIYSKTNRHAKALDNLNKSCHTRFPNSRKVGNTRAPLKKSKQSRQSLADTHVTQKSTKTGFQKRGEVSVANASDMDKKTNEVNQSSYLQHFPTLVIRLVRIDERRDSMCLSQIPIRSDISGNKCTQPEKIDHTNKATSCQELLSEVPENPSIDQNAIVQAFEAVPDLTMAHEAAGTLVQSNQSKIPADSEVLAKKIVPVASPAPIVTSTSSTSEFPAPSLTQTELVTSQAAAVTKKTFTETDSDTQMKKVGKFSNDKTIELLTSSLEITSKAMLYLTEVLTERKSNKEKNMKERRSNQRRNTNVRTVPRILSGDKTEQVKDEYPIIDLTDDNDMETSFLNDSQSDPISVNLLSSQPSNILGSPATSKMYYLNNNQSPNYCGTANELLTSSHFNITPPPSTDISCPCRTIPETQFSS